MANTDILIIGGGPAGLAAAIATRRRGFNVTVADAIVPPADKACGEGLMLDALAALSELGISIGAADSFPFRGIRFIDHGTAVEASFPPGCARGVRRTTLHRMMIERAEAVGVQLRWGARVDMGAVRCGWIIGADGEIFAGAKVGRARRSCPRPPPLRVSPALQDQTLDGPYGTLLGTRLPGLRHARDTRLGMCGGHLAEYRGTG